MATTVEQIITALASAYPVIAVVSPEEDRIERLIQRVGAAAKPNPLPVLTWNCLDGFGQAHPVSDPLAALAWVAQEAPQGFFLFKDITAMLDGNRFLLRRLRGPDRTPGDEPPPRRVCPDRQSVRVTRHPCPPRPAGPRKADGHRGRFPPSQNPA